MNTRESLVRERAVPAGLLILGLAPFVAAILQGEGWLQDRQSQIAILRLIGAVVIVAGGGFLLCWMFGVLLDPYPVALYKFIGVAVFAVTAVAFVPLPLILALVLVYGLYAWKLLELENTAVIPVALAMTLLHLVAHMIVPIAWSIGR